MITRSRRSLLAAAVVAVSAGACIAPMATSQAPAYAPAGSPAPGGGGMPSVYAGGLAGLQPMPTVPFSEAPPDTGKGWYCYEYQSIERGTVTTTSSTCERTRALCRASAERQRNSSGGSTHDPIRYEVGSCTAQQAAHCTYLWGDVKGGGAYQCHVAANDCRPLAYTQPGGPRQQSECGVLR